jgi:hypothetical protein
VVLVYGVTPSETLISKGANRFSEGTRRYGQGPVPEGLMETTSNELDDAPMAVRGRPYDVPRATPIGKGTLGHRSPSALAVLISLRMDDHRQPATNCRTCRVRYASIVFSNSGSGVKLSTVILAGPTVLSAVGACPPHDGVRRRWRINVESAVTLSGARKESNDLAIATVPAGTTFSRPVAGIL